MTINVPNRINCANSMHIGGSVFNLSRATRIEILTTDTFQQLEYIGTEMFQLYYTRRTK